MPNVPILWGGGWIEAKPNLRVVRNKSVRILLYGIKEVHLVARVGLRHETQLLRALLQKGEVETMVYHKVIGALSLILVGALAGLMQAAPAAAEGGQDYVVQADDWLNKLADKFYGDPLAYVLIVEATNQKASADSSYASIENPDRIEIGQKLFIPGVNQLSTETLAAAQQEQAMPDQEAVPPTEAQRQLLASLTVLGAPPELNNEVWLNSEPLKLADLRGKVVLVEFWTFG
jgi:hypothetical protein